ncbi:uncharacterized protein LOC111349843 [Spodoptera litura]|uniref:Uncharacterized protein LOC111349843 n=1 Tax=Spodoptera litura TaxID=69820 RepID=A0A9J7DV47_SPOLT|nr:uncharacterized protein LOC111349843 [Spodoptera litura]
MAAKYEKTKTQLVAIYKLEFYKNKKNWKLFEKTVKEPDSRPQTPNNKLCDCSKLNRTYSVEDVHAEPECDTEQSPLNKAFLHDEPGGTEDEEAPDLLPAEFDLPEPATQCLFQHQWGDREGMWGDIQQQEWCGAQAEGMPEELAYDHCDGPYHRDLWPPVREVSPGAVPGGLPSAELLRAADCCLHDTYCTLSELHDSLDESAEFIRGAHAAPHSSELELTDCNHECACVRELCWRLSSVQLQRALRSHRAALAALLHEAARRGTQVGPVVTE